MKKQPRSFSYEINQLVVAGFGMAFFLIFCACALLLFLTEGTHERFILKLLVMLAIYLALYISYSIFIVNRIKKMFLPLDKLANGLLKDQVFVDEGEKDLKAFADSLKEQARQMNELSKELKDTRENLDGVFLESREGKENLNKSISWLYAQAEYARRHKDELISGREEVSKILDELLSSEKTLKDRKNDYYELSGEIEKSVKENMHSQADTVSEFKELSGSYTLLESIFSESEDLLSSIYNEMTALQSQASQLNLYVMNTALDISRAGSITISALSAMDEIKLMSAGINDKTDNVILLIIRARNALKLAMDQSGECREKGIECSESFSGTADHLTALADNMKKFLDIGEGMVEETSVISQNVYDLKIKEEYRGQNEQQISADIDRIEDYVREWKEQENKN